MKNDMNNTFEEGYTKGLGFGFLLIVVGALFLGFNFGFIPMELKWVIISWPMLFLALGVINFFKRRMITGTILVFVGGFFIIPKVFPELGYNFIGIYWPILLIGGGIVILLNKFLGPNFFTENCNNKWSFHKQNHHHSKFNDNKTGFSKNSIFGSGEHIVLEKEFTGGELNAVFGGIKLDLRHTNLPEGDTRLEINAVFGGITIYVPNDWVVVTQLDAVFGGFEDNRLPKEPADSSKKLVITGACVFGGGELRN